MDALKKVVKNSNILSGNTAESKVVETVNNLTATENKEYTYSGNYTDKEEVEKYYFTAEYNKKLFGIKGYYGIKNNEEVASVTYDNQATELQVNASNGLYNRYVKDKTKTDGLFFTYGDKEDSAYKTYIEDAANKHQATIDTKATLAEKETAKNAASDADRVAQARIWKANNLTTEQRTSMEKTYAYSTAVEKLEAQKKAVELAKGSLEKAQNQLNSLKASYDANYMEEQTTVSFDEDGNPVISKKKVSKLSVLEEEVAKAKKQYDDSVAALNTLEARASELGEAYDKIVAAIAEKEAKKNEAEEAKKNEAANNSSTGNGNVVTNQTTTPATNNSNNNNNSNNGNSNQTQPGTVTTPASNAANNDVLAAVVTDTVLASTESGNVAQPVSTYVAAASSEVNSDRTETTESSDSTETYTAPTVAAAPAVYAAPALMATAPAAIAAEATAPAAGVAGVRANRQAAGGVTNRQANAGETARAQAVAEDSDKTNKATSDEALSLQADESLENKSKGIDLKDVVTITDEEVAKAAVGMDDEKQNMNLWWLLVVAALGATGEELYRRNKKKKALAEIHFEDEI